MSTQETDEELALRIQANMEKFGFHPTLEEIRVSIKKARDLNTPERMRRALEWGRSNMQDSGATPEEIDAIRPMTDENIAAMLSVDDDGRREERQARKDHLQRLADEAGDPWSYTKLKNDFRARGGHILPWDPPDAI